MSKKDELKHQINFWRNSNAANYEKWKEANYLKLELLEALKKIANHTSEADASISMREIAQEAIAKAEKQ
jgi:hypothetical protein